MKNFFKKNSSIITALFVVFLIVVITYIGFYIYIDEKTKFYESKSYEFVTLAKEYVVTNTDVIGKDIFLKLEKHKSVTDGVVYVNARGEVALAIIYDDAICYTKFYNSNVIINAFKPEVCIRLINLDVASYKHDDILTDEKDPVNDDKEESGNEDKPIVNDKYIQSLYNTYINYSIYETSNYKNINVNSTNSDEYLVKFAILGILNDNSVNIKNYKASNDIDEFVNGYKITTTQISKYIKEKFNINRNFDFANLKLNFILDGKQADVAYKYYSNEKYYKLVADSSIAKTKASDVIHYSKLTDYKLQGNEIFVYTDYLMVAKDMGASYPVCINQSNDCFYVDYYICNFDKDCILSDYKAAIGKFKHTFKKVNDNYYWVSSEQINSALLEGTEYGTSALSTAKMIVNGINNYCSAGEMKEQLFDEVNICKDGVSIDEVSKMISEYDGTITSISYYNKKVMYLAIIVYDRIVTYNNGAFTVIY